MIKPTGGGTFAKRSHTSPGGTLPYRLFIPVEYDASRRYPLIIWLHGAGGRGDDNEAQIAGDQVAGTEIWARPETQKTNPSFVFVPQTSTVWELDGPTAAQSPKSLPLVLQVMDLLAAEFPIDVSRVYLLGQSMGGAGVWELVTTHPERFAAAVLVCPVVKATQSLPKAARLPMWFFVGDRDGVATPVRDTIYQLRKAGGSPRFTEYAGEGHNIWTRVFKEPELAPWLFAQTR
jgi:predicted peptidase